LARGRGRIFKESGYILLGVLVLGETLLPRHLAGMALIGVGLAFIDGRLPRLLLRHRPIPRPVD